MVGGARDDRCFESCVVVGRIATRVPVPVGLS
jgi:hypothetical protein